MTTHKEALTLALEEIKRVKEICLREVGIGLCNEVVIAKIEEALEQPEQEPAAWMYPDALCDKACLYLCTKGFTQFPECATPPQRTWVGLKDEEIEEIFNKSAGYGRDDFRSFAKSIEAKLKEKNT